MVLIPYNNDGSIGGYNSSAMKTGLPVIGGHVKEHDKIVLDPSQTPSGKLCRYVYIPIATINQFIYLSQLSF